MTGIDTAAVRAFIAARSGAQGLDPDVLTGYNDVTLTLSQVRALCDEVDRLRSENDRMTRVMGDAMAAEEHALARVAALRAAVKAVLALFSDEHGPIEPDDPPRPGDTWSPVYIEGWDEAVDRCGSLVRAALDGLGATQSPPGQASDTTEAPAGRSTRAWGWTDTATGERSWIGNGDTTEAGR